MAANAIPDDARDLIDRCIDSVVLLEVLLFLRAEAAKEWTAEEIGSCLSVENNWLRQRLDGLREQGLLAAGTEKPVRYHYAPVTPALSGAVDALATAYKVRRVAVISLITERSTVVHIRSFADAFRLREDQ